MEKDIFIFEKFVGRTPLEAIEDLRRRNPELKNIKMSYAGRLDPMAEGLLLVLSGEKLKDQTHYWNLPKEYIAEFLLGASSDSGDVLGILKEHPVPEITEKEAGKIIEGLKGKINLPLPAFSSYRVKGKPLFEWAKEGGLSGEEIPERDMEIHGSEFLGIEFRLWEILQKEAVGRINLVRGDFRQEKAKESWLGFRAKKMEYPVLMVRINCSSGTYIRSLAGHIGSLFKTGALVFSLKRTRIGDFSL